MYLKLPKTSPSTLIYIRNYVHNKHTIHNILVLNVCTCIVYAHHILILIFASNKFVRRPKKSFLKILEAQSSHPQRMCWRKNIRVWRSLSSVGWSEEYQVFIICCEMLQSVGICWGVLGVGNKNRMLIDARVTNTQES